MSARSQCYLLFVSLTAAVCQCPSYSLSSQQLSITHTHTHMHTCTRTRTRTRTSEVAVLEDGALGNVVSSETETPQRGLKWPLVFSLRSPRRFFIAQRGFFEGGHAVRVPLSGSICSHKTTLLCVFTAFVFLLPTHRQTLRRPRWFVLLAQGLRGSTHVCSVDEWAVKNSW